MTLREDGPALAAALLLAAGAKAGYAVAGPDELRFMTAPTQALVGALRGIDFTWEAGYGYVSLADRLVISKSCTGVNYLLAVFGLLVFTLVPAAGGRRGKLVAVAPIAIAALGVTVIVNAARISLGVALHEGGLDRGWLDAERVHRLAGIVVYFVSLVGVHAAGRLALLTSARGAATSPLVVAPLIAYGLVAVAVPLANGALAARPLLFAEHVAWILGVTAVAAVPSLLLARRASGGRPTTSGPDRDRLCREACLVLLRDDRGGHGPAVAPVPAGHQRASSSPAHHPLRGRAGRG